MTEPTPFGTFITIDGITNGPKFTFMFRPSLPQYTLICPRLHEDGCDWKGEFVANWEDCEVGNGFLTFTDYEPGGNYRQLTYFVDFYHDGDPINEVWGFSLHLLHSGDPTDIEPEKLHPVTPMRQGK